VRDIDSSITLTWLDDARIQIDIEIINNETSEYDGYIRVPITEIESRYTGASGDPFHFSFLDFAFNKNISIDAEGVYQDSIIWDGKQHKDNHGTYFSDIKPENIKVIMGVFNKEDNYCDETTSALFPVNQPPSIPTIDGPTRVTKGISYQYNFSSTDPDGENLSYLIDWGDGDVTDWSDYQLPGSIFTSSHIWDTRGPHLIRVKARDIHLWVSDWGQMEINVPKKRERFGDFYQDILKDYLNFLDVFLKILNK
jgi:hypothetical protein